MFVPVPKSYDLKGNSINGVGVAYEVFHHLAVLVIVDTPEFHTFPANYTTSMKLIKKFLVDSMKLLISVNWVSGVAYGLYFVICYSFGVKALL